MHQIYIKNEIKKDQIQCRPRKFKKWMISKKIRENSEISDGYKK